MSSTTTRISRRQVPIAVKHSKHTRKTSKHVGHVGALAIALGVGGAIASAGVAWADDSSDTAAGRSNDSNQPHATLSTKMVRHQRNSQRSVGFDLPLPRSRVSRFPLPSPHPAQTRDQLSVDRRQRKQRDQHPNSTLSGRTSVGSAPRISATACGPFARTRPTPAPSAIWWWRQWRRSGTPKVCQNDGYAWGQFIDHDINLTLSDNVNHIDISIPAGDPVLSGSISLTRAVIDPLTSVAGKPPLTTNNVTGWLDGSMVYGSDAATAASLRSADGHLLTSAGSNLPIVNNAFVAGDIRAGEP